MIPVIKKIKTEIHHTQDMLLPWFAKSEGLYNYQPPAGSWSVPEILEHISLCSHYLLILIDKGAKKALNKARNTDPAFWDTAAAFHGDKLDEIGIHASFSWIRPEHMEPTGEKALAAVKTEILEQFDRCLQHLDQMPAGEGFLQKTTMTVNDLGKINVYEYIYFLAKHAQRHVGQMEKIENSFLSSKS